jgi:hypothetical protein
MVSKQSDINRNTLHENASSTTHNRPERLGELRRLTSRETVTAKNQ